MIQLPEERRPPLSPQLAVRVAVLSGIAFALFAIVFFRLWFLQVLSGDQYLAQANDNRVRRIQLQAPRGDIVDRNGAILVDNRSATSIVVVPPQLPEDPARRKEVFDRLAQLLDRPRKTSRCEIGESPTRPPQKVLDVNAIQCAVEESLYRLPYSNVTIEPDAQRAEFSYLFEHKAEFAGVDAQPSYLRRYPQGELAAHLFGTVGRVSEENLKDDNFRGVSQNSIVGQSGIEYSYDRYLRGRDGALRVSVDALGNARQFLRRREPQQGKNLRLSLDLGLQRAGQKALESVSAGNPGAFVAMDPRNGEVLAMGSSPSFDPNVFSKPLSQAKFDALNSEELGSPLFNRAIGGFYPTGSTFKVITAAAALQSGVTSTEEVINDPGFLYVGAQKFTNAGDVANGPVSLRRAIQVSSDVYFYEMGRRMNSPKPEGGALQRWASRFGLGRKTGIDLPDDGAGNIPSPRYRAQRNQQELECRERNNGDACGIADGNPWTVGQNVQTAVGQGDVQASPLQMAVAYSALANGGRVVKPRLGLQVEETTGQVAQEIRTRTARRLGMDEGNRQAIMDGLLAAATQPGGTSADVFEGFPKPVYGKTGTAERPPNPDQSWYVSYVPDANKPIVVAVTVERGGFGAESAAPAARLILSEWFNVEKELVRGSSATR